MTKKYYFLLLVTFLFGFNSWALNKKFEETNRKKLEKLRTIFEQNRKNLRENPGAFIKAADDYVQLNLGNNVFVEIPSQTSYVYFGLLKKSPLGLRPFQPQDFLRLSWQERKNPHRDRDILKNKELRKSIGGLYKIHLMVGCDLSKQEIKAAQITKKKAEQPELNQDKKTFTLFESNVDEGTDILFTLIRLMVQNPLFRKCVEVFKFDPNFQVEKDNTLENVSPVFVIYPYAGKENAEQAINILCKELEPVFKKAAEKKFTYLTPRYSVGLNNPKFPGIFYTQGDAAMKNFYWSNIVFDESTGLALFNPSYVYADSLKELKLQTTF